MRTKTILNIAAFYGFITVVCLGFFRTDCLASEERGDFRPVDSNRIPEVLNLISGKVMNNYGRIKTWQGKAEGILTYGKYRTVEFDLDLEKDLLYVNDSPAELIEDANIEGGRKIEPKKGYGSQISIVAPNYYIHSEPNTIYDGMVISRKAVKESHQKECFTCRSSLPFVFDPRSLFKQPMIIIQRSFPLIIKDTGKVGEDKTSGFTRKVEERINGNVIEYRVTESGKITQDPNDPNFLAMSSIFSGDKGFNITSQETTLHTPNGARITQKRIWDYNMVDGIYVLTKTMTQSYSLRTGESVFYEDIIFKNLKANQSIPNEVFSLRNLDLNDGDKFIDKIEGKEYKYKGSKLVFVADVNETPVKPNK